MSQLRDIGRPGARHRQYRRVATPTSGQRRRKDNPYSIQVSTLDSRADYTKLAVSEGEVDMYRAEKRKLRLGLT